MDSDKRVVELEGQVNQLQAELRNLRDQNKYLSRIRTRIAGFAIGVAARILLGPRLVASLRAWLKAKSLGDPFPLDQTADLGAALLSRAIRVGFGALVLAAVPAALLIWQNLLLRNQNESIQIQIEQQQAETLFARRAQYLDTIYAIDCSDAGGLKDCHPRAHHRARREAVLAFVEIERRTGVQVEESLHGVVADLRLVNLRDTSLFHADLNHVALDFANLRRADLRLADLRGASLTEASLREANLWGATVEGAALHRANLGRANLGTVNFFEAILEDADLSGADLRGARNLTQKQIEKARGNEQTQLPEGLGRPVHWTAESD